jgi:hypothetical protein
MYEAYSFSIHEKMEVIYKEGKLQEKGIIELSEEKVLNLNK